MTWFRRFLRRRQPVHREPFRNTDLIGYWRLGESDYPAPGFPNYIDGKSLEDWLKINGQWHHIVYVFPSATVYIDGKPPVGRDEFAIFDRKLSEDEVRGLYSAKSTRY